MATKKTDDGTATKKESGVGRVSVPGLKASKGIKERKDPDAGEYRIVCTKVEIKESQKSPGFSWKFTWKVLDGPKQEDGSNPIGLPVYTSTFIMGEMHPSYNQYSYIGVDELKSICLATGVAPRGDDINPSSFENQEASVVLAKRKEKTGKFDEETGDELMADRVYVKKWVVATE